MPFVLDNSKSIRYQEGLKAGMEKGMEKGLEKSVKILLQNTNYSVEEIARRTEMPVSTVEKIKLSLK